MARFVIADLSAAVPAWRMKLAMAVMYPVAMLVRVGLCDDRRIEQLSRPLAAFVARGIKVKF